mgnify:CR=1 FL=1
MEQETIEKIAKIEVMLEDVHHRLFGNGQPGQLSILDNRICLLEKLESKAKGAFWVISGLFVIVGLDRLVFLVRGK